MSKWAHFQIWAMRLTRLSFLFITAYHGGREAGSNVFTCCDILGPFCGILYISIWNGQHWLLSPCSYTTNMWAIPTCNRQNLGAISSRLYTQKHLDDLLHSAGKASPLFSGWGLSYNHRQHMHRRLLELDIPKIEMGTAVVINNLWSILNNTKAYIDASWLIFMHLELFLH